MFGLRLYIIYVNDLFDVIIFGNVFMYVDDIIIYCIGKSFDEVCFKLNKVLDELRFWSFRFKLSIYFIKIEVMIFIK